MSIEKITSSIMSDADKESAATLAAAKAECDAILAEADKTSTEIIKNSELSGQDEKTKLIERRNSVANIDARKVLLEEKQKLIAECFDKAVDKIVSMEKADYIAFLVDLAKRTKVTSGEIILNEKDASEIGDALIEALAKEIADSKITLSKENKNIRGGFLLKNGSVFINNTVEALVEESKEDLVSEVASQLFR